MVEEGLIGTASEVVVVAARRAWPEYQLCSAYICQPGRAFRPVKRIAFYSQGQVYPLVPSVLDMQDDVVLERGRYDGELGRLIAKLIDSIPESKKEVGHIYKVFLLSSPDDPKTMKLEGPILNDLESKTGQPTAFTMGQRYVAVEKLAKAKTTSDLV